MREEFMAPCRSVVCDHSSAPSEPLNALRVVPCSSLRRATTMSLLAASDAAPSCIEISVLGDVFGRGTAIDHDGDPATQVTLATLPLAVNTIPNVAPDGATTRPDTRGSLG